VDLALAGVYVIHENREWTDHLMRELDALGVPAEEWHLDRGLLDLHEAPPEGVFFNRMSPSSHTRGHRYAPELTGAVLAWLEQHGRRVVNGSRSLRLEVSKVAQYTALSRHGIRTPRTVAAVGREEIVRAAERFAGRPFITKHNRAGKGLGVQLFHTVAGLRQYVHGPDFEDSVDGITLVQAYIEAPEPYITRAEFIGGRFFYAVRVDTSRGFQLCPADACQVGDLFCPAGDGAAPERPRFTILEGFDDPILARYEAFLAASGIEVAGIEFIRDSAGELYTYDLNSNTNYNSEAEAAAGRFAWREVARFLGRELERVSPTPAGTSVR
jgi:hypothetical protein